jgi:hypothetical protein
MFYDLDKEIFFLKHPIKQKNFRKVKQLSESFKRLEK